jgi:hypothetical protein
MSTNLKLALLAGAASATVSAILSGTVGGAVTAFVVATAACFGLNILIDRLMK